MFPYFTASVDKADEKQQLVTVLTAISDVRKGAITHMVVGEIDADGRDLVFYLDGEEVNRIELPNPPRLSEGIFFNRYGIASGGEIIIEFRKRYHIVIEEVSGKLSLE